MREVQFVWTSTADADTETIDLWTDAATKGMLSYPKYWSGIVAISGTTAVIAIAVAGSIDGTTYTNIVNWTAGATEDHAPTPDMGEPANPILVYRYIKITVTTVGAGNTDTITLLGAGL